ncbi:EAL domain-containing protein [Phyllobacterium sp. 21LDTY02-6]|uniref:putative bifunctional diguanylate cyclase/phosphodiesterase n=1 Tax=unclassified Phyllobacterium TaxID=2638441 RepID=UPI00201FB545|nr:MULTISPECIES: GGDEF domain-containing phosphodiesterase [unclassified Phyllobacterium]MCO4317613.1 EAL domain-containing protein [Phyllobacterium sp. 21LDTY02-6]MCX8293014.1 EAL domain-containing protein [Phyllobacterium sp. 0TCS1.6A]
MVRSEREFQAILRRLELALDASQIGVWEHNVDTEELHWDVQMHRLYATGLSVQKVNSALWLNSIHPDDRARALEDFNRAARNHGDYSSDYRIVWPDGSIHYMRSRAYRYEDGAATTYIGAEWDVSADVQLNRELQNQTAIAEARSIALEASTAQIAYAAEHDYLTGLPNRRYFDKRLRELVKADVERLAVLHVDLDYFKQVNDTAGHAAGDFVLKSAALMVASVVPSSGFVARMGGDEFVVVLPDFGSLAELEMVAQHIVRLLKQGVTYGEVLLQTGVSIGVAWTDDGRSENLLAESDLALYRAKKRGRNRVEFFAPHHKVELSRDRRIAEHVKLGLKRGEFIPHYQVQVDARSQQIVGMEALARWQHPTRGLLDPEAFLKVMATLGLMAELDTVILEHVLKDRRTWQGCGLSVPRIAVNTSASRLSDPGLSEQLRHLRIEPHSISFELLESVFLDEIDDDVLMNIATLERMDVDIEIDDFGSGHASIIGLLKLKPKRLKIDRRLVMPITTSREQRILVRSIVDIAKALGIGVIAEGVETPEHARLLRRLGCDTLQGYAIAYPAAAAAIGDRLLAEQSAATLVLSR